jgi:Ca-activated chloride channel family protein
MSPARTALILLLALATSLATPGAGPQAQTPPPRRPTFGVGVALIRLSLSVTDGRKRLVPGLSEGDFAIFEDGVRQDVSYFTRDPVPLSVALLIDCSASMTEKLPVAQEAASRFVAALRPEDLGQVVQFNDRVTVLQDFTESHAALDKAIRSTQAAGTTVLYTALYVSLKQLARQANPDAPRRRAIVLLTDGEDTASVVADEQVLELARQTDVGIYIISLRTDRPLERQGQAFGEASHFVASLARDTGGEVYVPSALSELNSVYGRVADELRSQYTLGYVSSNVRRDGKWRRIVVRTPIHADLQVRHRVGYYAPRG